MDRGDRVRRISDPTLTGTVRDVYCEVPFAGLAIVEVEWDEIGVVSLVDVSALMPENGVVDPLRIDSPARTGPDGAPVGELAYKRWLEEHRKLAHTEQHVRPVTPRNPGDV